MKNRIYICLITLGLFIDYSSAQSIKQDCGMYLLYLKNIQDSTLATGIYKIGYNFMYEDDWRFKNYRVEYKQHVNDIEIEQPAVFSKRKVKTHYIYSTSSVIAEDKPKYIGFARKLDGTNEKFKINPLPIALKENIIRIYDSKHLNNDSTFYPGLTLKIDYCSDTSICKDPYNRYAEDPKIGLVVNNELVAVTSYIIRFKPYRAKNIEIYLEFYFPHKTVEEVEKIKKVLFRQTLYIDR